MAKSGFAGVLEIIFGTWFILKFFNLNVDFFGIRTELFAAAGVIMIVLLHSFSVKSERPSEDAVTITIFNMMLSILPIVYIFMNLNPNSSGAVGGGVTLGFGIFIIITGLINLF